MLNTIDLGDINSAPAAAKAAHPTVTVSDPEMTRLLEQFTEKNPQFKKLEKQTEAIKKQLAPMIRELFFDKFDGITPETSTMLVNVGDNVVKMIVKDLYSKSVTNPIELAMAIGEENVTKHFKQATVFKLELAKIPEDKQAEFAKRVVALAKELGCMGAVSATQCLQPKAGFHEARTTLLTKEQNLELDKIMPVSAFPQF